MFAFASGAGIMGEAGPEAILPLKRGSDGKLGVQSGGSAPQSVRIEVENRSGTAIQASNASVRFDTEGMVVRIITDDIRRGGPIRSAFTQMVAA
jgi:phage-related minor tail protein